MTHGVTTAMMNSVILSPSAGLLASLLLLVGDSNSTGTQAVGEAPAIFLVPARLCYVLSLAHRYIVVVTRLNIKPRQLAARRDFRTLAAVEVGGDNARREPRQRTHHNDATVVAQMSFCRFVVLGERVTKAAITRSQRLPHGLVKDVGVPRELRRLADIFQQLPARGEGNDKHSIAPEFVVTVGVFLNRVISHTHILWVISSNDNLGFVFLPSERPDSSFTGGAVWSAPVWRLLPSPRPLAARRDFRTLAAVEAAKTLTQQSANPLTVAESRPQPRA